MSNPTGGGLPAESRGRSWILVDKAILDNGIRVITEELPRSRSISIGVLVDAGPADEGVQGGLAHLVEHLLFQGTASRDALAIARLMDGAGGQVGGFVTRDYTCFTAHVLDDYRYHALDLLGDALLNSTFPEAAVERQKDAIACELEARRDSPSHLAEDLVKQLAWSGHPLGRPLAGTPETVRELTRESAIYFVGRHYTPDRVVIAAAGHLEHADFVAQTRDAFWRLLGEGPTRRAEAAPHRGGTVFHHAPIGQAYFALALPAFPFAAAERYALHVLDRLLGGGISSRLFRRVREERGLAYAIGSSYQAYGEGGMLLVEGSTAPESLPAVLRLVLEELGRLASGEEPVDDEELARAVTSLVNQHLIAGEGSATRMSRLATQELYFGRQLADEEIVAALSRVHRRRLAELAESWLAPSLERAALAVVGAEDRLGIAADSLSDLLAEARLAAVA